MEDRKICVVGLGGVGGYVGGMLAKYHRNVYFYMHGKRLDSIRKNGLLVKSKAQGEFIVHPKMASDNTLELGVMDYVLLCVKHFSLQQVLTEMSPLIGANTVILPLLNGVENANKIKKLLGKGVLLEGLIYIISSTDENYAIHHTSPYGNIHFGLSDTNDENKALMTNLKSILDEAHIKCTIEEDIHAATWRKYILNCGFNIITAYYNATTGDIRKNAEAVKEFKLLLKEGCTVARALNVAISPTLEEELFHHVMTKQDENSTSSLNRDMLAEKENELEVFSGDMLRIASKLGIRLPSTEFFYNALKNRP